MAAAPEIPEEAAKLVSELGLEAHPEGGFYKRAYQSDATIEGDLDAGKYKGGERHVMTHIFFLLCRGQVSHLHRIASDELWHFYGGDPLTVVEADPSAGAIRETTLGRSRPFHSVKGGVWFGARPEGEWSLVGCTVAPGFDFRDFELATPETAAAELGALAGHASVVQLLPSEPAE